MMPGHARMQRPTVCSRSKLKCLNMRSFPWIGSATLRSTVRLDKLIVCSGVKKYPALYGHPGLITVFTRARHWSLSWSRWIQSTPSNPVFLTHFNIILPVTPRSSLWSLPFRLFQPKFCKHFSSLPWALHALPSVIKSPFVHPDMTRNYVLCFELPLAFQRRR
jgi:hypothetical protein